MVNGSPDRKPNALWIQAVATAVVGGQFGLMEAWFLSSGGIVVRFGDLMEMTAGHAVVGLALGIPVIFVLLLIPRSVVPRALSDLLPVLPSQFVLFSMAAITMNVRDLRTVLHPAILAWDVGILVAVCLAGWLWVRRPWGRRIDTGLVGALVLFNVVVISVATWPGRSDTTTVRAQSRAPQDAPNILFFLIDTLRADHLGIYGYPKPTTPRLDAFAREGTIFERAYANATWTRPSMASLHSSSMPSRHGVVAIDTGLPPSLPLLAETLTAMGYRSAFFTNGVNVSPDIGYARGVEHFDVPQSVAAVERAPVFSDFALRLLPGIRTWLREGRESTSPGDRNKKVIEWAQNVDKQKPVFLYVHYMGPHSPYMPPEEFSTKFSDLPPQRRLASAPKKDAGPDALPPHDVEQMIAQYDGEILMHDFHVDHLLGELRALGWLDNAIVVITADHGEAFGEHGVWGHGRGLFNEVVRIPLVVWSSQPWNRPRRLEVPASLVDLAPTLVDLVGGEVPEQWDGGSLRPWLVGEREDNDRIVFQELVPFEQGLRNAEWAYFESDYEDGASRWLYLTSDTAQENDLSARYPTQTEEFHELVQDRNELDSSRQASATTLTLDEETTERLRALGYVD